jgi:hypothetical protein
MTRLEIAALVCKGVGLWFLAQAAIKCIEVATYLAVLVVSYELEPSSLTQSSGRGILFICLPTIAHFAIGTFCWKRSKWLAAKMVDDSPEPVVNLALSAENLLALALTVTGFVLFANSGPQITHIILYVADRASGAEQTTLPPFTPLLQLGLAIWLIFGSRGIARFAHRSRPADTPDVSSANDESREV